MKRFYLLFLLIVIKIITFGVTAYPGKIQFTQPNGEQVSIFMKGDEFVKYAQTEDGFTLLYDSEGFFNYAFFNSDGNLVPSTYHAKDIQNRSRVEVDFLSSIQHHLYFSTIQINSFQYIRSLTENRLAEISTKNTKGALRLLCILMGFPDKPFVKTNADFQNLFNQIGYNYGNAAGSVHDFYAEASYYSLNVYFDVVGPFIASENMSYYGSNTFGDASQLAYEAIQFANPLVDFSNYDNDMDGNVDGLYLIFAGNGEEAGAGGDAIWSHAGGVSAYEDNVQINGYACSPEHRGASGTSITYIGVICHELGHVLGAPDYYDTNYETGGSYEGTGSWDLMASGSWNGSGRTPAHPNPRIKVYTYNWAEVEVLNTAQTVFLPPSLYYGNAFYRINTSTTNEYFIIENRVSQSFDQGNPGSGMMIYRCASNVGSWNINTTHRQKFYPVAANSTQSLPTALVYGSIDAPSCPWPGTLSKTTFTDTTNPSMKSWANANTNKPITNITLNPNSDIISFDFMGGGTTTSYPVFIPSRLGATITLENGSTSPVMAGGSFSFSVLVSPNFSNSTLYVRVGNDTLVSLNNIYTISNINAPVVIELLNLTINKYPIVAYQSINGTITPDDTTLINHGASFTYSIVPSVGFSIADVYVDSVSVGPLNTYTFSNVTSPHSIYAQFQNGSPDIIQSSSNNLHFSTIQYIPSNHQISNISADVSQLSINVLVKAPPHFQVSLNGSTWVSQVVMQKSNLPQDLYIRFNPSIVGLIQDTIKIASSGALTYLFVTGESSLSIQDKETQLPEFQLFPNPANSILNIRLSEISSKYLPLKMEVYDVYYHKVMDVLLLDSDHQVDVNQWATGVYFVVISIENRRLVKKIVIQ